MLSIITTQLLHQDPQQHPLGRITLAGTIHHSVGIGWPTMRVLGSYALVYLLAGAGAFADALGADRPVTAGDLILLFPDVAHRYGPPRGQPWDEIYLVFDGPVFDAWRTAGLLDPRDPVWRAEPIDYTYQQLRDVVGTAPPAAQMPNPLAMVARLQAALAALVTQHRHPAPDDRTWLGAAQALLEPALDGPADAHAAARAAGMSYERFRKKFRALAGVSPKRYADQRVIARACALMHRRRITNRALAKACGFCDEFHFARRFHAIMGLWPADFRRTLPRGT